MLQKNCNGIGCDELLPLGERFCNACAKERYKKYTKNVREKINYKHSDTQFYNSPIWLGERRAWLKKEPYCRDCDKADRIQLAEMVDHIVPISRGGAKLDRSNFQSLCHKCHNRKRQKESMLNEITEGLVTVVCGPPGSGKTTYVKQNRKYDDLVVDLDAIMSAITLSDWYSKPEVLLKYAIFVQDRLIDAISINFDARAWIITTGALKRQRDLFKKRLKADIVVLEVDAYQCYQRIRADSRREKQSEMFYKLAKDWWAEYERDSTNIIIKQ